MAETTVKNLADVVGTPVDKLLTQMKEAGLPHVDADALVNDEQKQTLLSHLRKSHGSADADPKKITLKRKTQSTIKTTGSSGKAKTVAVEVRKKRTYVKREVLEEQEREREEQERLEAEAIAAEAAARVAAEEAARKAADADDERSRQKEEAAATPEALRGAEEKAKKAAEDKAKRLSVPKVAGKGAAKKADGKKETAEERVEREAEEKRKREADEVRRKQEAEVRKKAEEEAARRTAEEAARIAADLESRTPEEKPAKEEDDGSVIVTEALEASFRDEERSSRRRRRKPGARGEEGKAVAHGQMKSSFQKAHGFKSPTEKMVYEVEVPETITVAELALRMNVKAKEVTKALMHMGEMVTANQPVDQETALLLVEEMGHTPRAVKTEEESLQDDLANIGSNEGELTPRAPVVTIMGHVDHGKTSLLDYIRRAKVADGEAGGITQHIGAYHVETDKGMITFLDTPGHAAFTAMRARGAKATDIVVIVVAADDGVMPQTEEAINHAKASGVPLIIAVNKMDKESADPERVKSELSQREIISEEWGGEYQFKYVSAHTGDGVDDLLDAILLQAELLELKAVAVGPARGVVIESRIEKGRGTIASVLVQEGELAVGDMLLAGGNFGRVRALNDENGKSIKKSGPSIPVEVLGLDGAPEAGELVQVVPDEKKAREVAEFRQVRDRDVKLKRQQASKLENLFENMGSPEAQQVNIVLKADVRGSLEALLGALHDLSTDEVKVTVITSGVGAINESEVNLAMTSGAVLLGFNVRADSAAKRLCESEGIDLRYYSIIYELIDDVKSAMSGLLPPEKREEILGVAEVRDVFRSSKFGAVAGSMVVEGTLYRNRPIRVLRSDVVVFEGELESLRRFKEDVPEVRNGMECGIAVKSYNDVKAGDKIEVFEIREIARSL
ncbi:MAG: translation initiation factor IF-2 [Gammaproteobacteria bacterium]|jgi:translation initiation factor IF-2|nr:translation initiation factor IF-2 [Gammaproteobacteria bacterium]